LPGTTSAVGRVRYSCINAISGSVQVMAVVVAAVSLMSMTSQIELIKANVLNRRADAAEPFVLLMVDNGTVLKEFESVTFGMLLPLQPPTGSPRTGEAGSEASLRTFASDGASPMPPAFSGTARAVR
jgi:hypothetical protein